ncbi:hypothetical protein HII31_09773, partial [Pseudocercospora fuligena]
MASVRRSTSRLLVQTHNTEAQRRLYSKKPGSRNPIPKVNARGFDTTFDVVKPPRPRRDAATSSLSKFVRVELVRTCVQSPMWWIQTFIVIAIFSMLPPWEDNPENREWVEKYCPWASWGLVKSKKQREQEESAGADR